MLEGNWPVAENTRLQRCGRYTVFACLLTLATFGVALFTAYSWDNPGFVSLSAALQVGLSGEDDDLTDQGFSVNESEMSASELQGRFWPDQKNVTSNATTEVVPRTAVSLPGTSKLILVNCAEDGKPIKKKGSKDRILHCPHQCNMTNNKADLSRADAVVFNPLWMAPLKVPPRTKAPGQIWAYSFHFESASGHGFARGTTKALSGKVDLTMTYKGRSDIFRPYYRLSALQPGLPDVHVDYAKGKPYLLLWFVSNCGARGRMSLFKQLQKLLGPDKAHMFGSCGMRSGCKSKHSADPCNVQLMSKYKFYAAFECFGMLRCKRGSKALLFRGVGLTYQMSNCCYFVSSLLCNVSAHVSIFSFEESTCGLFKLSLWYVCCLR